MRLITLCLALLLIAIQYPLWLGKGGWLRVMDLEGQVEVAQEKNEGLKLRNTKLAAEVKDLKNGIESVEELARRQLSMVKDGEIFVQILGKGAQLQEVAASASRR